MTRPPHLQIPADALVPAVRDRLVRSPEVQAAASAFARQVAAASPPLQHLVPVLALARAAAGLALLFGDPAFIDLVAQEAHRALRDGTVTVHDLFGRSEP